MRAVTFEDVSFAYEGGAPVFERVSVELPAVPVLWVRTDGDRGRSTFLKLVAGLVEPTGGRVLVGGRDGRTSSFAEGVALRRSIGYGFDFGGLLSAYSLRQNLILPLTYHGVCNEDRAGREVDEIFEIFGLGEVAHERPFHVTGSQRKLTCVLRAFVHQPELILLDEPLTGLKREMIAMLLEFTREAFAKRGLARVILTGENPLLAEPLGARILNISRDRIWSEGT